MQKIEKHDVASLCNRIADVLFDEIEIIINAPLYRVGALDFAAVTVKAANRREKVPLAQIESQQANPTADVEERLARFSKQLESRRKNWVAAQFSPGIHAQPAFTKTRRHPRADVETCDLSFQVVTPPAHGTLGSVANQLCVTLLPPYSDKATIKYTPAAGWFGADSFTYRVGAGGLWSAPATVSVTTRDPVRLHIGDLDGSRTVGSTKWTATVRFVVHQAAEGTVTGVTVSGSWSGGATGTATCKTSSSGVCTVSKANIPNGTPSVTFTVTNLALSPMVYQPSANHDPDGDSTGTSIVVMKAL
jgi:hypothetical protein